MRHAAVTALAMTLALAACQKKAAEQVAPVPDNPETRHTLATAPPDNGAPSDATGAQPPAAYGALPVDGATSPGTTPPVAPAANLAGAPRLAFPLACEIGKTCEVQHYLDRDPGPGVLDYRCAHRTYEGHNGIDIRISDMAAQRRGVAVLAAAPGRVTRLRDGVQDISIRAPGAPSVANMECGNGVVVDHGGGWETQYCHLARGSVRLRQGDVVKAGDPLANIGLSGNTEFPHLHITVRHNGKIVDPFAPDEAAPTGCKAQASLWTPQAAAQMAYKAGAILNAGIAGSAVNMEAIEAGQVAAPSAQAPVLAAYIRVIEPQQGDEMELILTGPGGLDVRQRLPPLDRDKAQYFQMVGKKRPAGGWPAGLYVADLKVWRAGKVALQKRVSAKL